MRDFWVFGYGSLMWNPGFEVLERRRAKVYGLHRSLCVHSWVHRGTREKPGLVLGLDRGGSCHGIALRASAERRDEIIDYLRERELVTNVYLESWWPVLLDGQERAPALLYRVDQQHAQYARGLSIERQREIIRSSHGKSGPNDEYVRSTLHFMRESGIRDLRLEQLADKL